MEEVKTAETPVKRTRKRRTTTDKTEAPKRRRRVTKAEQKAEPKVEQKVEESKTVIDPIQKDIPPIAVPITSVSAEIPVAVCTGDVTEKKAEEAQKAEEELPPPPEEISVNQDVADEDKDARLKKMAKYFLIIIAIIGFTLGSVALICNL